MLSKIMQSIQAELQLPKTDKSIQQALKVKELMGPVTSFWFDRIIPSLTNIPHSDLLEVLKFAKAECEAAVHKDSDQMLFAVYCLQNRLKPSQAVASFPGYIPPKVKHILAKTRPSTTPLTSLRIGRWARQRIMPLLKNWKTATFNDIIDTIKSIHRRFKLHKPNVNACIAPVEVNSPANTPQRFVIAHGAAVKLDDNGTFLLISGQPQDVASCFHYPKTVLQSLKRPAGMFAKLLKQFFVTIVKDTLDISKLRNMLLSDRISAEIADLRTIDALSFSSINHPLSVIVRKSASDRKHKLEYLLNPFAHFTELKRSSHTAFFKHPFCSTDLAVRLAVALDLKVRPEIPLCQGITLFIDPEDPNADEFCRYLTGLPVSLSGDGYLVSKHFERSVRGLTLPKVYKLQGAGRAKGVKIAEFDGFEVEWRNRIFEIDIVQNIQGKRKNKLANIVAACMRFLKYNGVPMPVIDVTTPPDLEFIENVLKACMVEIEFAGRSIQAIIGIQKFFIDVSMDYTASQAPVAVDYAQAVIVQEILNIRDDVDRLPRSDENLELAKRAVEWMEFCMKVLEQIESNVPTAWRLHGVIDKRERIAVACKSLNRTTAELLNAIVNRDFETLSVLTNMAIEVPMINGTMKIKPLQMMCVVDGETFLHEFSHAFRSYIEALVDYSANMHKYTRKWLALQIAKIYKCAANAFTKAMTAPRGFAIQGRHATSSLTTNTVLVPKDLYYCVLNNAKLYGQVKKNVWILVRHPIVGAMPIVNVQPADCDVILVPKHLAKEIDGDDDGDIVYVFPV